MQEVGLSSYTVCAVGRCRVQIPVPSIIKFDGGDDYGMGRDMGIR